MATSSEVRAVCGNAASTDPRGGLLARAVPTANELSREFGVSEWAITRWVKQADRDAGRGDGGLTTAEREELVRLRREIRQLKIERELLATATTWFATQETTRNPKRSSDS